MKRILSFPCKRIRDISLPVVERNAFFAHPENILLGMLGSEDEEIRRLGVNKVLSFRKEIPRYNINPDYENGRTQEEIETQSNIRKFQVPKININADVFYRMVDVDDVSVQEPPLLKHLSTHDIENIRSEPLKLGHPCHNQKVERHIKLVSENLPPRRRAESMPKRLFDGRRRMCGAEFRPESSRPKSRDH